MVNLVGLENGAREISRGQKLIALGSSLFLLTSLALVLRPTICSIAVTPTKSGECNTSIFLNALEADIFVVVPTLLLGLGKTLRGNKMITNSKK